MNPDDKPEPTKRTFAEEIEYAAKHLPEGWSIVVHVEHGDATITVMRPDETEVQMHDRHVESDIEEQFQEAVQLAVNETEAAKAAKEKQDTQ